MIERVLILAAVLALAATMVRWWERRRRTAPTGTGITVVVGAACRLCDQALAALRRHDPTLPISVVPAAEATGVRSVPTVLVVGREGQVVMARSGRSAVADAGRLVEVARAVEGRV